MTARDELRAWMTRSTGIELERGGVGRALDNLVEVRCRELGCSQRQYLERLKRDESELALASNAITVVYTWFFRDAGQMAAVESALRQLASERPTPLQVWVPGCATGEDCFSIAMLAAKLQIAVNILGTDINTGALTQARSGRFPKASLREVPNLMRHHFQHQSDGRHELSATIRRPVRFERHNLASRPPTAEGEGSWDLVLCRNVLIYFLPERALEVFQGIADELSTGGVVMLGASEVVYDVPAGLSPVYHAGRLVLRRTDVGERTKACRPKDNLSSGVLPAPAPTTRAPLPAIPTHAEDLLDREPDAPSPPSTEPRSTYLAVGHEHLDRGELPQAMAAYERAAEVSPEHAEPRMYVGVARYLSGDVEQAAHDLRAALFLDGGLWQASFYLALSYESLGLADQALREYRNVVVLCEQRLEGGTSTHLLGAWQADILQLARRRVARGGAPSASLNANHPDDERYGSQNTTAR